MEKGCHIPQYWIIRLVLNRSRESWDTFQLSLSLNYFKCISLSAMYKTRNTGMGNGMRGTWGIGEMLYSRECCQTFRGMSSNIRGNVTKHSGECRQIFRGMSPNILANVVKNSGEYSKIFENNLWHVVKHSMESMKGFGWMYIIVLDTGDQIMNFTYLLKNRY